MQVARRGRVRAREHHRRSGHRQRRSDGECNLRTTPCDLPGMAPLGKTQGAALERRRTGQRSQTGSPCEDRRDGSRPEWEVEMLLLRVERASAVELIVLPLAQLLSPQIEPGILTRCRTRVSEQLIRFRCCLSFSSSRSSRKSDLTSRSWNVGASTRFCSIGSRSRSWPLWWHDVNNPKQAPVYIASSRATGYQHLFGESNHSISLKRKLQ